MKKGVLPASFAFMASVAFFSGEAQAESQVFNPQQRAEIVDIVRHALKEDPQILSDAVQSLRDQATAQKRQQSLARVRANWSALSMAPTYAIRGNVHGKITVVEFLDPRCGYCRRMAPLVDEFLSKHPDVRLVEKIIPVLGEGSVLETRAIYAAALQGKYDAMRRALMEDNAHPDEEQIKNHAERLGIDFQKLESDMSGPAVTAIIAGTLGQAQAIDVEGTPTFLFGQAAMAPGAMDIGQMDSLLEQARKF